MTMWKNFERRWLAAYDLLHIAAYRLLGQPYRHTPGLIRAQPTATLTRGQHLFTLLFPLLVVLLAALGVGLLWLTTYQTFFPHLAPRVYYTTAPLWHIGLQLLLVLLPLFAAPAYFDVREAIRLLTIHPTKTVTGDR